MSLCTEDEGRTKLCPFSFSSSRTRQCVASEKRKRVMKRRIRPTPRPEVGPAVMRATEQELRAMYADIVAEGVPERFAELLRRLDEPTDPSK
jgi:Anti-sigma factor NepR